MEDSHLLARFKLPFPPKATQIPKQEVAPAFRGIPKSKLNSG